MNMWDLLDEAKQCEYCEERNDLSAVLITEKPLKYQDPILENFAWVCAMHFEKVSENSTYSIRELPTPYLIAFDQTREVIQEEDGVYIVTYDAQKPEEVWIRAKYGDETKLTDNE